ncbi:MAG: DUF4388 domain-containing protein [Desulfobacterales bacterium]
MSRQADLSGNLGFLNLGELLQLVGGGSATGTLRIHHERVPKPGVIWIDQGNPVDARNGSLRGLEALFSLFGWTEGRFEFTREEVRAERVIRKGRMEIILDGLRLLDEGRIPRLSASSAPAPAGAESGEPPLERCVEPPAVIKGPLVDYALVVDEESFYDGDEIVREGSHGNWIWVVLEGTAEVVKQTPAGPFRLLKVGDGAFIGSLSSLMTGENLRSTSILAAGNIQLGMLDSQLLASELERVSNDFKTLIKSLERRLRQVTDIAAQAYAGEEGYRELLHDKKMVVRQGQKEERLFSIREGEAVIARGGSEGYLPLGRLAKGDVFGNLPFLTLGHEPFEAAIFSSADLKLGTLDVSSLEAEFRALSPTLRNMVIHLAACISATTLLTLQHIRHAAAGGGLAA